MNETLDILYNVTGQSLYFDAPEGRPSSVTDSTVYEATDSDDGSSESATTGSAAVETSPNTTLDDAAAVGATTIPLTATTGTSIGRKFLITSATTGNTEWVEVRKITSSASVGIREPLTEAFAASDTFEGTRITHAIDSTWVADRDNISLYDDPNPRYRWVLTYVVGGESYRHHILFDLVRYRGKHTVTGLDVDRDYMGAWLDRLPTYHREDQGAALIDAAYRAVKMHLRQHGHADQMIRAPEVVDELVIHEAAKRIESLFELATARYTERFNNLIMAPKVPFDDANEGGGSPTTPMPLFRR